MATAQERAQQLAQRSDALQQKPTSPKGSSFEFFKQRKNEAATDIREQLVREGFSRQEAEQATSGFFESREAEQLSSMRGRRAAQAREKAEERARNIQLTRKQTSTGAGIIISEKEVGGGLTETKAVVPTKFTSGPREPRQVERPRTIITDASQPKSDLVPRFKRREGRVSGEGGFSTTPIVERTARTVQTLRRQGKEVKVKEGIITAQQPFSSLDPRSSRVETIKISTGRTAITPRSARVELTGPSQVGRDFDKVRPKKSILKRTDEKVSKSLGLDKVEGKGVGRGQTFSEFFKTLPSNKNLPLTNPNFFKFDKGVLQAFSIANPERLKVGASQVVSLTGFGATKTIDFAIKKPATFAATLGAFAVSRNIGARGISAVTGIGLKSSKAGFDAGAFSAFVGLKAKEDPKSVTTPAGALATTTEFATFSFGARVASAGAASALTFSPRTLPFAKTSPESLGFGISTPKTQAPVSKDLSQVNIFLTGTRLGTQREQAVSPQIFQQQQFFSTTATTPTSFKTSGLVSSLLGSKRTGKQQLAFKDSFTVKQPKLEDVGPDRRKFGETFFFTSRSEAFTGFGEQASSRLGSAVVRGSPTGTVKRFFSPSRIGELFRFQSPTILRFTGETPSKFPASLQSRIERGEASPQLRRRLVNVVSSRPGELFPGTKTSSGQGRELEFVAAPGTKIFFKDSPQRRVFSPTSGSFQRVVDVGLTPGKTPKTRYNFAQRARNVVDITLQETLGIRSFDIKGLPKTTSKGVKGLKEKVTRDRDAIRASRRLIPNRRTFRAATRSTPRVREVERALRPTTRDTTRARDVVRPREIFREQTRTRDITRPRDPIRTRETTRVRDPFRERIVSRPRDRFRPSTPRRPGRRDPRIGIPRIPISTFDKRLTGSSRISLPTFAEKGNRKFKGTPTLNVILGGSGTQLTKAQKTGKAFISPFSTRSF